ncbi:GroES-like protein [Xylariaceae sp. FL1651]|nr:GroES-like protein [Xylariaceae sp. FL1651]
MPSRVYTPGNGEGHDLPLPLFHTAMKQAVGGVLAVVTNASMPSLRPGMALVRVIAVGLNPTDFKMAANFPTAGATGGCDFAGTVVRVGGDKDRESEDDSGHYSHLQPGDRVFGAVHGSNPADKAQGAFAEYVLAPASMLARIPNGVTWEQAASLGGVGHGTVAQAFWSCMGLQYTPDEPATGSSVFPVLVYGGSTATGTMAIQMLRLSGLKPIAVCSTRNFALARRYGAAAVFDYMSPSCATDIRTYTGNALFYALDCISDAQSVEICYAALGRAGGRYVCLEHQPDEVLARRRAIRPEFLMGYDMFGKGIALPGYYGREPNQGRHELGKKWYATMERLLAQGDIQFHPIQVVKGKWDGIINGLDLLRKGEVSGMKLVVRLSWE